MKLEHIGIVVENIPAYIEKNKLFWAEASIGDIILNETQQVRECFIQLGQTRLELLEPLDERSPVFSFLKKGGGVHHFCYEVEDLEEAIQKIKNARGVLVRPPVPDVAFGNRRICFCYYKKQVVELVETD